MCVIDSWAHIWFISSFAFKIGYDTITSSSHIHEAVTEADVNASWMFHQEEYFFSSLCQIAFVGAAPDNL
jgi:hypothetical protein